MCAAGGDVTRIEKSMTKKKREDKKFSLLNENKRAGRGSDVNIQSVKDLRSFQGYWLRGQKGAALLSRCDPFLRLASIILKSPGQFKRLKQWFSNFKMIFINPIPRD